MIKYRGKQYKINVDLNDFEDRLLSLREAYRGDCSYQSLLDNIDFGTEVLLENDELEDEIDDLLDEVNDEVNDEEVTQEVAENVLVCDANEKLDAMQLKSLVTILSDYLNQYGDNLEVQMRYNNELIPISKIQVLGKGKRGDLILTSSSTNSLKLSTLIRHLNNYLSYYSTKSDVYCMTPDQSILGFTVRLYKGDVANE
jgi:hypothetical protein